MDSGSGPTLQHCDFTAFGAERVLGVLEMRHCLDCMLYMLFIGGICMFSSTMGFDAHIMFSRSFLY
jgi:hypothetical protein